MTRIGWNARGLLQPLWVKYPGGREGLAEAVGTQPTVLSSINSGNRRLGMDLAQRLARALNVPLTALGTPAEPIHSSAVLTGWGELVQLLLEQEGPLTAEARAMLRAAADELQLSSEASARVAAVLRDRLARENDV